MSATASTKGAISIIVVVVGGLVIAFGGIFATIGFVMHAKAPDTDSTTQGVIVQTSGFDTCSGSASFEVDGQTYTAHTTINTDSMCRRAPGSEVEVRYASADPTVNEFGMRQTTFGWIFMGVGAVPIVIGLVVILLGIFVPRRIRTTPAAVPFDVPPAPDPPPEPGASPDGIRAGWYPTEDGAHERWHNGMGWSEHTRPAQRSPEGSPDA